MKRSILLLAIASLCGAASAQSMKPGLWEMQHRMPLDATQQKQLEEARKQMAAMPPAQRKQIEDMMASQGIGLDLEGGGTKVKVCLTKEDVSRDQPPIDRRGDCQYDSNRSGNVYRVKYRCTKPVSQGEVESTLVSPERTTMKMTGTDEKGRPIAMQGEGRWLGADCGGLKPASQAQPK